MNMFRLDGEVALITGGGSGLGYAMAKRCVEAGAQVVICGRRKELLAHSCEEIGPACQYEIFDVTKTESVSHLVQSVRSRLGDPTILINNAGINMKKPALEFSDEEMDLILRTHVHGAFALTREVAASMLERGKGSILFIASMASYIGLSQVVPYAAGKSAVLGMVRTLANEWSAQGVRVNAIAPGFIETPMVQKALQGDADRRNRVLLRTPMGKLGEPDDIAYAAVYLCSPAAKYVTGTTLVVDGGTSIGF